MRSIQERLQGTVLFIYLKNIWKRVYFIGASTLIDKVADIRSRMQIEYLKKRFRQLGIPEDDKTVADRWGTPKWPVQIYLFRNYLFHFYGVVNQTYLTIETGIVRNPATTAR
jgi:hypothetical protein